MTDARGFSVDDIRPDRLMQDLQKVPDIAAKRRQLLARQGEFVTVPCPACGERAAAPEFTKGGFPYVRCAGCDLVYNNPRPDQAMLAEYYRDNPLYAFWNEKIFLQTEPARLEKIFRPRVDRVLELCRENGIAGGTLLEVGAGYGTFCVEMKARGFFERVVAVEPTEALAETCRRRGLETVESTFEDVDPAGLNARILVSFEVLEHLFAPGDFVAFAARALVTGGLLVLSFPAMDGFDNLVLGERSGSVGGEHINMFNRSSITALLTRRGFRPVHFSTPGFLDAELVRKAHLAGTVDLSGQPFLKRILVDEWEEKGGPFQDFLRGAGLSSHMFVAAVKEGD